MMPQQTSLLGMMRFLLLSNDENLFNVEQNVIKSDKMAEVNTLVGERGFSVNPDGVNSFGAILSVGPCCLYGDNECYYRASADHAFLSVNWKGIKAVVNGKEVEIPELKVKKNDKEDRSSTLQKVLSEGTKEGKKKALEKFHSSKSIENHTLFFLYI